MTIKIDQVSPPPWECEESIGPPVIYDKDGRPIAVLSQGVLSGRYTQEMIDKNGELIAMAPNLLEESIYLRRRVVEMELLLTKVDTILDLHLPDLPIRDEVEIYLNEAL